MSDMGNSQSVRLVIGTASFLSRYGVANHEPAKIAEIRRIMEVAAEAGFYGFDTAPSYGNSEASLHGVADLGLKVISKLPAGSRDSESIFESVRASLGRLGAEYLDALLFHDARDVIEASDTAKSAISRLLDQGLIRSWGVSVYDTEALLRLLDHAPMVIQAPMNFLDRRFLASDVLNSLRDANTDIHYRSLFLQGFLLMEPKFLPASLRMWTHVSASFGSLADSLGLSRYELAIRFALSASADNKLVVGVNALSQLEQLIAEVENPRALTFYDALIVENMEHLVDPRLWGQSA